MKTIGFIERLGAGAAFCVIVLAACSEKRDDSSFAPVSTPDSPVGLPAPAPEEAAVEEQPGVPLEQILVGLWQAVEPGQIEGARKATIDFRQDRTFTMTIQVEDEQHHSGTYTVSGDALEMTVEGQESNAITTEFKRGVLTVTDVAAEQSVDFERLE